MIFMKKQRKKYERPKRPWDKERIESEKKLKETYGLRRKNEIWRAESILRNYRRIARQLAANADAEKQKVIINKLHKLGLIHANATLDDVLALQTESLLDRRLQTVVMRKGLANTLKQARQYIVHGHIALGGRRNRWPSTIVKLDEEASVSFYPRSKVKESLLKPKVAPKKEVPKPEALKEVPKEEPKVEEKAEEVKEEPKAEEPKPEGEVNAGETAKE